jgi:chromate transporter
MNWKLLWDIFILFTRVAMFSWGGGPASLALMQRETTSAMWIPSGSTEAQPWLNPAEFADAVAVGNALPGPIAPQVSAYVGYKLAGTPGAVAAAAGTVVPTTILMLFMVAFFFGIKDSPSVKAMLQAVRPLVVGLLIWTAYDMFSSVFGVSKLGWAALTTSWDKLLIVLVSFALLTFTSINPVVLVIAAAILGFFVYRQ